MTTKLRLAVLGDSIAWGQGATRPDERLPQRLADGLRDHGHDVETLVHAVPGARSAGLVAQVDAVLAGDPPVAAVDVVVVVIGANDLTHLVPVEQAVAALRTAVERLVAAGVEVVVAPAPDLSAVPWVPPALRETVRLASVTLHREQGRAVAAAGGRVADPDHRASRAFAVDPSLFSADRFHPSSAGYAVIAASLLPELLAAVEQLESHRRS